MMIAIFLPVYDSASMEAFQSTGYLSCIELGSFLRKFHILPQMPEELSSIEEIHHEVKLVFGLESVM